MAVEIIFVFALVQNFNEAEKKDELMFECRKRKKYFGSNFSKPVKMQINNREKLICNLYF